MHNIKNQMDLKAIQTGFDKKSLFFGALWALYHGVWGIAIPVLLIQLFIISLGYKKYVFTFQLCTAFVFFIFSEEIRLYWLQVLGYKNASLVYANSEEEAIFKYLERVDGSELRSE